MKQIIIIIFFIFSFPYILSMENSLENKQKHSSDPDLIEKIFPIADQSRSLATTNQYHRSRANFSQQTIKLSDEINNNPHEKLLTNQKMKLNTILLFLYLQNKSLTHKIARQTKEIEQLTQNNVELLKGISHIQNQNIAAPKIFTKQNAILTSATNTFSKRHNNSALSYIQPIGYIIFFAPIFYGLKTLHRSN